jgi:hypothetical protein
VKGNRCPSRKLNSIITIALAFYKKPGFIYKASGGISDAMEKKTQQLQRAAICPKLKRDVV